MNRNNFSFLCRRELWGSDEIFGLSREDRRQHVYAVGKSGTGKSTLLRNMILQDIKNREGVAVIDPHGDLAESVLAAIPSRRARDVVYFDPADIEYPIAFNPLAKVDCERRPVIASGIVSAMKSIWSDSWGPRLEYILYATVAALLECEGVSLLAIPRMLVDGAFRRWITGQVTDPIIHSFWEHEFENYGIAFQREAIAPIQNKIGQLLASPVVRNIVGQARSRIDFGFMMNNRRIFIANLSKGKVGADKSALLGAFLVTQFQLAAMERSKMKEEERQDFYLYVDEFSSFMSDAFASVLSEARKYRLCLILANQFIDQLRPLVRDAVFGNVGTIVAFRCGNHDGKILAAEFGDGYTPGNFINLANYEVWVKATVRGEQMMPFNGRALPGPVISFDRSPSLVSESRRRFSTPRNMVEEKIRRWMRT